ncbi:MAG: LuxR C-terminal-related transcriptional regulator [Bacteroidota bacterium]
MLLIWRLLFVILFGSCVELGYVGRRPRRRRRPLPSKGLTSQGIGHELFISKYTVETHRKNILRKLEVNSSTELVKFAIQQGLLS